ncbi:MAG: hypothetical protein ABI197_00865 [Granulicella sp.]
MSERVSIPIAIFEVTSEYARPDLRLLMDRVRVVEALFEAFKPWDIKVDDIEVVSEGKPSEQGIKFKLSTKRISFFVGAGSCKFTHDNANWESAEETIKILSLGLDTLIEVNKIKVAAYKTAIAMHLQPKSLPFIEILKPFAPSSLAKLDSSPIKAVASVVKWEKRRITIDGSGQLANGVFLKFEREFEGSISFNEMALRLKADEDELFDILGIEEDLS